MIELNNLYKNFKIYKKAPGISGSIKSFFVRDYEIKQAVKPFDANIEKGEIIGLLGPNGAGKTTLMKMLSGIIVPSGGNIKVLGYIPHKRIREFRKKIALVMGQKSQLWWDLPAMDSFYLLQKYYEIDESDYKNRVSELAELLNVTDILHVHVRKLSLGERMKVELMACLLHNPEVIFLDEPTIGLDIIAQKHVRKFLLDYHSLTKSTIIITSHYMADIEALCSKLILIIDGQKQFDGSIDSFTEMFGHKKSMSFSFSHSISSDDNIWNAYMPSWNDDYTRVELNVPKEKIRQIGLEILKKYPVTDFKTDKMPIENVLKNILENPDLLKSNNV